MLHALLNEEMKLRELRWRRRRDKTHENISGSEKKKKMKEKNSSKQKRKYVQMPNNNQYSDPRPLGGDKQYIRYQGRWGCKESLARFDQNKLRLQNLKW